MISHVKDDMIAQDHVEFEDGGFVEGNEVGSDDVDAVMPDDEHFFGEAEAEDDDCDAGYF